MRGSSWGWARPGFARFLLSGGFNTAVTYLVYLALLNFFSYRISYSISYVLGIGLAYVLNRIFVFKSHRGLVSVLMMPLIYAIQYGLGMVILFVWVELLGFPDKIAPLVAVLFTIPVTYLLSRFVFTSGRDAG